MPDAALVSSARRTTSTWLAVAEGGSFDARRRHSESLYTAGPETALDLVRETGDDVTALVVIGHNPTMAYLAQLLDDGTGDAEAGREMAVGFPTGALAGSRWTARWADLELGVGARLVGFHVGADRDARSVRTRLSTGQTGGAGVTTPCSRSSASISSRLMPSRYMIASR